MKTFLLLVLISFQLVWAQQVTFFKTFGHGIYDSGEGVWQANDTGYVVGGITTQSGTNGTDMLIYKTDSLGNLQWYKNIGLQNSIEGAKSITGCRTYNEYLLAGYQNKYDTSGYNFYAVKTNASGDTLWSRIYGGSDWDMAYSADTLQDSTYVIAGETFSFGNGNLDMYVIRINRNGDTLWTRTFGGTEDDYARYVFTDRHNNILVMGTTHSFGNGGSDVYLVYLNAMGDTIWTKAYGTLEDEIGYSGDMYIDNSNKMSFGFAYTQYNPISDVQESRIFRLDSIAALIFYDFPLYFNQPEILDNMRMRRDGNGRFYYTGDLRYLAEGPTDVNLHRTTYGMGFSTITYVLPLPEYEYPKDVRKCFDKGLVVTGSTTTYGPGPTSTFILKTDTILGVPPTPVVSAENYDWVDFNVFPNPVTNHLINIDAGKAIEEIRLIDLNGKVVQVIKGQEFTSQTVVINELTTGMYIIEVITNAGVGRKKLFIQN
jgi:Secretion system C-terminal sorting domain